MKNKFFKIGNNQEENLNWLLNRIFYNAQCGRKVYVISSSILNYADIFSAYEDTYHRTCPASVFSDKVKMDNDSVLCVNDLFGNFHCNILNVIADNADKCKFLYVTLTGNTIED